MIFDLLFFVALAGSAVVFVLRPIRLSLTGALRSSLRRRAHRTHTIEAGRLSGRSPERTIPDISEVSS